MLERVLTLLRTLLKLGFRNVATAALYKLSVRLRWYRFTMPIASAQRVHLFLQISPPSAPSGVNRKAILGQADELLKGTLTYFSCHKMQVGSPPDWFLDPFSKQDVPFSQKHWSQISDFGVVSDIKAVWEASRWDWILTLSQAYSLTGDARYFDCLDKWSSNWIFQNPLNQGPNWKCGQEASIRVLNVLLAAYLLGQHLTPTDALKDFVIRHCKRIYATRHYALSQMNNHAISEAAALYVCGNWLETVGLCSASVENLARKYAVEGRKQLVTCVKRFVEEDGTFSQYSVNYHRVLIDMLSMVEFWRKLLGQLPFPDSYIMRVKAAADWLYHMTSSISGYAPNIGANDGTRLFSLSNASYGDYRPSIQSAFILFAGRRAYSPGPWDEKATWLGLTSINQQLPSHWQVAEYRQGGYVIIDGSKKNEFRVIVRTPCFRFRPSHADAFHLDLWLEGKNVLRDGGTFSYAVDGKTLDYYSGTRSHNTVEFDGRDQMSRIGRFLFGSWIHMQEYSVVQNLSGASWMGVYEDYKGCKHKRTVSVDQDTCRVVDELQGDYKKAIIRWRLLPISWTLQGDVCSSDIISIASCADTCAKLCLTQGRESLFYLKETNLPVLEMSVNSPCSVETVISINRKS